MKITYTEIIKDLLRVDGKCIMKMKNKKEFFVNPKLIKFKNTTMELLTIDGFINIKENEIYSIIRDSKYIKFTEYNNVFKLENGKLV